MVPSKPIQSRIIFGSPIRKSYIVFQMMTAPEINPKGTPWRGQVSPVFDMLSPETSSIGCAHSLALGPSSGPAQCSSWYRQGRALYRMWPPRSRRTAHCRRAAVGRSSPHNQISRSSACGLSWLPSSSRLFFSRFSILNACLVLLKSSLVWFCCFSFFLMAMSSTGRLIVCDCCISSEFSK